MGEVILKWELGANGIRIWTYGENSRFYGFTGDKMKGSGSCLGKAMDAQNCMSRGPDIFHPFLQIQSLSLYALLCTLGRWFLHTYSLRLPCLPVSSCTWPIEGTRKRAMHEKTESMIDSPCSFLQGQGLTMALLRYISLQLLTGSTLPAATTLAKFSTHTSVTYPSTRLPSVAFLSVPFFPAACCLVEHSEGTEHGQVCSLEW